MADLTPELAEDWRREAEFHHDRYLRDGTGVTTVLALTQARLLRALNELAAVRAEVDRLTARLSTEAPRSAADARAEKERLMAVDHYGRRGLAARR